MFVPSAPSGDPPYQHHIQLKCFVMFYMKSL